MVKYFLAVSDQGMAVYLHNPALERPWYRYGPATRKWMDIGPPLDGVPLFELGAPYERAI